MAADNAVAVKAAAAGRSLHGLGVICGLAAGVWLGAAEAPTKLVNAGFSPFAVSLCMVAGVFTARWTFPTLLKGTSYVFADLFARKHLIVWAILAGALWAVANTLTVFAIRDVGLATAFPLWNTNSLIGLLWGVLLFRELQGAPAKNIVKVVCGAICIVGAAIMLGFSTIQGAGGAAPHAVRGLLAAAGASLMWGTMYVPYRKAYLSGMNPLSFVTAFTAGELGTMFLLTWTLDGGMKSSAFQLLHSRQLLFWLFLGGFVWVVGDLFQQFAAKYLGHRAWYSALEHRTSFGVWPGGRWYLASWPQRTGLILPWSWEDRYSCSSGRCQSALRWRRLAKQFRVTMRFNESAIATAWTIARCCWLSPERNSAAVANAAVGGM